MPYKLHNHCAMNLNATFVLIFGGFNQEKKFQSNILAYDISNDNWINFVNKSVPCRTPASGYQANCALVSHLKVE